MMRYDLWFTSMSLPTIAPYATADCPLKGPPWSLTVTLAVEDFNGEAGGLRRPHPYAPSVL